MSAIYRDSHRALPAGRGRRSDLRGPLAEVLRRGGSQLTIASGVAGARTAIAARRPDLAILDILLAHESGLDLGALA